MRWLWAVGIVLGIGPANTPAPFTVQHQGQTVTRAERAEFTMPALPLVDADKWQERLRTLERGIRREPVDARIGADNSIVPERVGYRLDSAKLTDRFQAYFYGGAPSDVDAPLLPLYPRVDEELLASLRDKAIGRYVTYYNSHNENRSHNIVLAAKAIDSTVVFPGETFSFNRTVGKRVKERGYRRATVIVRGELAEDIGGGICQVSSTLFNAADRAGLKIVRRYSHSRHVPYVPPGRDATVSWQGPDFIFRNEYNQPVLIRARAGAGGIQVSILSSDLIEYKPRHVRSMTRRLPEEIPTGPNVGVLRKPEP